MTHNDLLLDQDNYGSQISGVNVPSTVGRPSRAHSQRMKERSKHLGLKKKALGLPRIAMGRAFWRTACCCSISLSSSSRCQNGSWCTPSESELRVVKRLISSQASLPLHARLASNLGSLIFGATLSVSSIFHISGRSHLTVIRQHMKVRTSEVKRVAM